MAHFTALSCGIPVNPDCADPDYRIEHLGECPDDPRCIDPDFAAANPTLCLNTARMFIKPSAAVVQILGEAQYKAFLFIGGTEVELLTGVLWSVSDLNIALMGAGSGNATGVAVGIVTVTATYGALSATARLEVVASCAARVNNFLMLFDVSRSSGGAFTELLGTRLDVAKSVGMEFNLQTNYVKDKAAVLSFDSIPVTVQAFTDDRNLITAAIDGLETTAGYTALGVFLQLANDYFDTEGISATGRVIVLFTDGENNKGITNPLTVANAIKATGTILIIVGLRAKGTAFSLLENMASGGFFINALPSNVNQVAGWLNGLREYLCSENCQPAGDVSVGVGQLNYTLWNNWDVTDAEVDLVGKNPLGPPFYDLWPGNGLYMDDHGSGPDFFGEVTSKDDFAIDAGVMYRLTVSIAGNNRESSSRTTRVRVGTVLDQEAVRTYTQPFTDSVWEFSTGFDEVAKIIINGLENPGTTQSFGNFIGRVLLENVDTGEILLDDNFDNENVQVIPPGCGSGEYYGYCPGQGCLDGSLPAQSPDPSPLPNMEGESNAAP